jgi:hypothetical protein
MLLLRWVRFKILLLTEKRRQQLHELRHIFEGGRLDARLAGVLGHESGLNEARG